MGFSLTGAHVIFFISAVIAAGAVSGIFIAITTNISSSLSERGSRIVQQLDTEFAIINDPTNIPLQDTAHIFYIKNIGAKQIETTNDTFTLFIDGNLLTKPDFTFANTTIAPEAVTILYTRTVLTAGDHTLRIVGPLATENEFQFHI
jgi:archaeal flagellar protein FlaG